VDFGGHLVEPLFRFVVPGGQAVVFFAVVILVLCDMGVLVDAVLNESRNHVQLLGQPVPLFFKLRGIL